MSDPILTTQGLARAFKPEEIGQLVVQPVIKQSVAIQAAGATSATGNTHVYRVPIITADPTAAWTAEGAEIDVTKGTYDEVYDHFHKLAGLTRITREAVADTNPAAMTMAGEGLARDIATKLDAAFFGTRESSTIQPQGLEDLTTVTKVYTGAAAWANTDVFTKAIYNMKALGTEPTAFVAHPDDALALSTLKETTDSNRPLLTPDPTAPTQQTIQGVPLLTSPHVTEGTVWALPKGRTLIVIREGTTLDMDKSRYFTSDEWAVKATMRVTFLYPHEAAVQKILLGTED